MVRSFTFAPLLPLSPLHPPFTPSTPRSGRAKKGGGKLWRYGGSPFFLHKKPAQKKSPVGALQRADVHTLYTKKIKKLAQSINQKK